MQFTIKRYAEHKGVTNELHQLNIGDELILKEPFGTINYKRRGIFIAGGAGITPFISIFRDLKEKNQLKGNKLIFSNKTSKDIILEKELKKMFGNDVTFILTRKQEGKQNNQKYEYGRINEKFLRKNLNNLSQPFYICGPKIFVREIRETLAKLGVRAEEIIFEK